MNSKNRSIGKHPSNQGDRRKSLIIPLILAVILLIMVSACQKSTETVAETATPTLDISQKQSTTTKSSNQVSNATPTETGIPDLSDMVSGTPVPDWNGIPLMPGALAGSEVDENYLFTTTAPLEDAVAFYNLEMPKLGWTARLENETPDVSGIITLAFEKDDVLSLIGFIPQTDGLMVMLGQQEKP